MAIYLGLALMPVLIRFFLSLRFPGDVINRQGKPKLYYCLLCGFLIFLVIALRSYSVGSRDSTNYYNTWLRCRDYPIQYLPVLWKLTGMEKGYVSTVWALSHVFRDPQFVFVFSGALFAFAVARTAYRYSDTPLISFEIFICLGMYTFMVQGMRQAVAMSLCMLSFPYIRDRKFFRFLLIMLIAWLFHQTVLIFLVVYPFYGVRLTKAKAIVLAVGGLAAIALSPLLVDYANRLFNRDYSGVVDEGGYVATAVYLLILAVGIVYVFRHPDDQEYTFWLFLLYIGCIFYIIRYVGVRVSHRVSFYFMFSQMIALPNAMSLFNRRSKWLVRVLIVALCIALFAYRLPREGLVPYTFFWQQ